MSHIRQFAGIALCGVGVFLMLLAGVAFESVPGVAFELALIPAILMLIVGFTLMRRSAIGAESSKVKLPLRIRLGLIFGAVLQVLSSMILILGGLAMFTSEAGTDQMDGGVFLVIFSLIGLAFGTSFRIGSSTITPETPPDSTNE